MESEENTTPRSIDDVKSELVKLLKKPSNLAWLCKKIRDTYYVTVHEGESVRSFQIVQGDEEERMNQESHKFKLMHCRSITVLKPDKLMSEDLLQESFVRILNKRKCPSEFDISTCIMHTVRSIVDQYKKKIAAVEYNKKLGEKIKTNHGSVYSLKTSNAHDQKEDWMLKKEYGYHDDEEAREDKIYAKNIMYNPEKVFLNKELNGLMLSLVSDDDGLIEFTMHCFENDVGTLIELGSELGKTESDITNIKKKMKRRLAKLGNDWVKKTKSVEVADAVFRDIPRTRRCYFQRSQHRGSWSNIKW